MSESNNGDSTDPVEELELKISTLEHRRAKLADQLGRASEPAYVAQLDAEIAGLDEQVSALKAHITSIKRNNHQ